MRRITVFCIVCGVIGAQVAFGIEYKRNVISGAGGTTRTMRTTLQTFSAGSIGGSNKTVVTTGTPVKHIQFGGDFDWGGGLTKKTLQQRIRESEQKLHKLYFMRDVCRTLEDEITISFDQKDIREVMKQVGEIKGDPIPFEVPAGAFLVEKSNIAGMPLDQFLEAVASVSGLALQYTPHKLVFIKVE